jgi:catechol 2,3-dioxygenase-like lactoylglutathione lyase family enzyme
MAVKVQVTFDAADPPRLAAFWGEVLGYVEQDPPQGFASWAAWAEANGIPREEWGNWAARVDPDGVGPRLYFQRVPEPKTAKNRVHLDLNVGGGRDTPPEEARARVAAAVERAVAAGATKVREAEEHGEFWVVLQDPEGNEFCFQ